MMMSRYQEFKSRILEEAAKATQLKPYLRVSIKLLANEHGIPQIHIREELLRLADGGSISLSAWDGERERKYDEWPDANSFFSNATDKGHVRIRPLGKACEPMSHVTSLER
jgi:hypothetical protein